MSDVETSPANMAGFDALRNDGVRLILPIQGMTCHSCVGRVGAALEQIPGIRVDRVTVGSAHVTVNSGAVSALSLQDAVRVAGYVPGEPVSAPGDHWTGVGFGGAESGRLGNAGAMSTGVALVGLAGSIGLLAFYLIVMGVAQGFDAATGLLQEDWYLFAPLVAGFGVQVGLFAYMRRLHQIRGSSAGAVTGASASISGVSMLACCAHHLADLVPILGLSGLALFLGEYRQPLMVLGIVSNLAGIAYMARLVKRCQQTA